jgi:hypothetical protein
MKRCKAHILILLLLILFSCHSANMKEVTSSSASSDSSVVTSAIVPYSSSHFNMNDSTIEKSGHNLQESPAFGESPVFDTKKRQAVFGYSFFKKIQQNETRPVYAYVSIINAVSEVIDTLRQINASEIPERKSDTAVIFTKNMFVFKALTVNLLNAGDSDFIIKPFTEAHQIIDSLDGNSWSWEVTPLTHKKYSKLIMNVVVEKPDGSREPFSTINIPIIIQLDKHLSRTIWDWMMRNPEKVITIILIPFIIFFWKQITGLFKKKKDNEKDQ